jgi:hypothetical protein
MHLIVLCSPHFGRVHNIRLSFRPIKKIDEQTTAFSGSLASFLKKIVGRMNGIGILRLDRGLILFDPG